MRRRAVEYAPRGGQHCRRRLDLGIAKGEVEDLVGAALLLEAGALLEHAADPRGLGQIVGDGARDDHGLHSTPVNLSSSARWQATRCPGEVAWTAGACVRHTSIACGQRGWK